MRFALAALIVAWPSVALAYGPRANPQCVIGAATGTTYYACDCVSGAQAGCTTGSDVAAGTSPATAWQTWEKMRTQIVAANNGDRFLLCQGGNFGVTNTSIVNTTLTTIGGGVVIDWYQAGWGGAGVRPRLTVPAGQDAIDLNTSSNVGPYTIADLEIVGLGNSGVGGQAFGIFMYGNGHDTTICNLYIHNMQIAVNIARAAETDRQSNHTIRDCTFTGNWGQGFLGGGENFMLLRSYFDLNGTRPGLDHDVYMVGANGSDQSQPSDTMTMQDCELTRSTWTAGTGCQASEFTAHGLMANLTIQGNYVHEAIGTIDPGCWGIAPAPGYIYTEKLTNVIVRNNVIENVGNSGIPAGSWNGGLIENNVIINVQGVTDKAISMSENECHSTGPGSCSDNAGIGPPGGVDFTLTGVTVRNNSFLLDVGTAVSIRNAGSGYYSVNNAAYITSGTGPCFDFPLSTGSYTAIDYNDCFISGGTGAHWQGAQTLATWNGATGFDGHSLTTNPAFLSLTSPYSLAFLNTSPLYNAGSTANGSATDILGVTRPQSTATDIGAYELLVGIPTPAAPGRNRPIAYGGWFLLMLFVLGVGACAGALSVKRRRAALAEGEHVHLIDEHTTLALEEMRRDGIGLPVNEHCEVCVRRMFGERKG